MEGSTNLNTMVPHPDFFTHTPSHSSIITFFSLRCSQ